MRLLVWAALLFCASASAQTNPDILFADGIEDCSTYLDNDQDRLIECQEVLGNVSDPNLADTDGDGLKDGDEVLGTIDGLNLPAMGAKPKRKTILVEIDWADDAFQCGEGAHSHRPAAAVVTQAREVFAAANVPNPDASTGIDLIVDYGQGGVFTGGNVVPLADGMVDQLGPVFYATKNASFAANRRGRFHYQLWAHRYGSTGNGSSGWAEIGGDDGIVSLYCLRSESNQVISLVHEIGHNFALDHGGNTGCNNKPNYNSIMNYRYQFYGMDTNCDGLADDVSKVDYSYGKNNTLDENHLNEALGICPAGDPNAKPLDWDGSPTVYTDLSWNLNSYDKEIGECGATKTILIDHADWQNLDLAVIRFSTGGAQPQPTPMDQCATPPGGP